jgi:hypothetical protein
MLDMNIKNTILKTFASKHCRVIYMKFSKANKPGHFMKTLVAILIIIFSLNVFAQEACQSGELEQVKSVVSLWEDDRRESALSLLDEVQVGQLSCESSIGLFEEGVELAVCGYVSQISFHQIDIKGPNSHHRLGILKENVSCEGVRETVTAFQKIK